MKENKQRKKRKRSTRRRGERKRLEPEGRKEKEARVFGKIHLLRIYRDYFDHESRLGWITPAHTQCVPVSEKQKKRREREGEGEIESERVRVSE